MKLKKCASKTSSCFVGYNRYIKFLAKVRMMLGFRARSQACPVPNNPVAAVAPLTWHLHHIAGPQWLDCKKETLIGLGLVVWDSKGAFK